MAVPSTIQEKPRRKRWWLAGAGALALIITAIVASQMFTATPAPRILKTTQITRDGRLKGGSLVTDGARLYFGEVIAGNNALAQVSSLGGETGIIATTLTFPSIVDISPSGSELLNTGTSFRTTRFGCYPCPRDLLIH